WSMPSAATASRWSEDCACQPSSAATTKHTIGAGPSPVSVLPRKRSCPGTSTKERSEEHTSELQSRFDLVCRLLLEKKNRKKRGVPQRKSRDGTRERRGPGP